MILVRSVLTHVMRRYGSSANLVLTTGHGVNGYTLDASLGEFILTHPDVCHAVLRQTGIGQSMFMLMLRGLTDQDPATRQDLLVQRG